MTEDDDRTDIFGIPYQPPERDQASLPAVWRGRALLAFERPKELRDQVVQPPSLSEKVRVAGELPRLWPRMGLLEAHHVGELPAPRRGTSRIEERAGSSVDRAAAF